MKYEVTVAGASTKSRDIPAAQETSPVAENYHLYYRATERSLFKPICPSVARQYDWHRNSLKSANRDDTNTAFSKTLAILIILVP